MKVTPLHFGNITNKRKLSFNRKTHKSLNFDDDDYSKLDLTENSVIRKHKNSKDLKTLINKIRVHFFFTEIMEISEFVKNTKIEIRITDGPDWNKYLVFGETKPFELMNPHKEDIVQTENKTIYFFPKNMDEFYLTMKCGLKFDKDIQTENLTLSMYNGVYFPDNNYYNSDVLPIEWMEIFEKKEYLNELEEKSEITTLFDPNWTKQQLDYVQETDSFLNKTILKIDSDKQTLSKRPKSSVDFIRMNKNIIKSLNQSPTLIHSKIDIKSSRNQPRIIDELKKSYKTARTLNLNIMDKRITEEFYEDEKLSKNIDIENKLKPLVLKNNE